MARRLFVKSIAINVLKLSVVVLLLWWMIATGKLDLAAMRIFITSPSIIIAGVIIWILGPVLLGTLRWWLLLKGAGLECRFSRAMFLQLIGFFFNNAMPGAVGGDIVKAIYIVRDQTLSSGKTPAMLSVLLDRIVGLIGLFVMGMVAALLNYELMASNVATRNLMHGLAAVLVGSSIFLGLVFIPYRDGRDPFARFLSLNWPGFSILAGIYRALRSYRDHAGILFGTIGISVVIQFLYFGYMGYVGMEMYPNQFDPRLLAPVFPFGVLVTAVPLAPGGLGVGHAAFDKLFQLVGLPGGANVFNIFTLSQLALNLLCFIPYLSVKKTIDKDMEDKVL